jgi:hypothetical protein
MVELAKLAMAAACFEALLLLFEFDVLFPKL